MIFVLLYPCTPIESFESDIHPPTELYIDVGLEEHSFSYGFVKKEKKEKKNLFRPRLEESKKTFSRSILRPY